MIQHRIPEKTNEDLKKSRECIFKGEVLNSSSVKKNENCFKFDIINYINICLKCCFQKCVMQPTTH